MASAIGRICWADEPVLLDLYRIAMAIIGGALTAVLRYIDRPQWSGLDFGTNYCQILQRETEKAPRITAMAHEPVPDSRSAAAIAIGLRVSCNAGFSYGSGSSAT